MKQELLDSICSIFRQSLTYNGYSGDIEQTVATYRMAFEAGYGMGYESAKQKYLAIINEDDIS